MKVVFITPFFPPHIGGVERYVNNVAVGLAERGWEVIVITTHNGTTMRKERRGLLSIYKLPYLFKLFNTPIHISWFFSIKSIIEKENPHIINVHTPVPVIADIAARVVDRKKLVVTYHNDIQKDSFIQSVLSWCINTFVIQHTLRRARKIIIDTPIYSSKSKLLRLFKKKIEVISPGIDIEKFSEKDTDRPSSAEKKYLLFVGNLNKNYQYKGLNYLLSAMEILKPKIPDICLKIVGSGDYLEYYQSVVKKMNAESQIHFCGKLSDTELRAMYQQAYLLVLPSTDNSEGFGIVLLEAGANSLPVIASKVGGIPYVVQHEVTGLLVAPKKIQELAEAIENVWNNTEFANSMGAAAYNYVKKEFSLKSQVEKTHELFLQLL